MPSLFPPIDRSASLASAEPHAASRKPADAGGTSFDAVFSDQQSKSAAASKQSDDDTPEAAKDQSTSATPDVAAPKANKSAGGKNHRAQQKDQPGDRSDKAVDEKDDEDQKSASSPVTEETDTAASPAAHDPLEATHPKADEPHEVTGKTDPLVASLATQPTMQGKIAPIKATSDRDPRRGSQQKPPGVSSASDASAEASPTSATTTAGDASATATDPSDAAADVDAPAAGKKAKAFALKLGQAHDADDQLPADARTTKARAAGNPSTTPTTPLDSSVLSAIGEMSQAASLADHPSDATADDDTNALSAANVAQGTSASTHASATTATQKLQQPATPDGAGTTAEGRFADANHANIVSAVHADLLPNGGTMKLRLDPPELGALHVTVAVRDGVISANFHASSEQAARLLSHSLGDLKSMLETQGVTVEKLHVTQSPRGENASNNNNNSDSKSQGDSQGRGDEANDNDSTRRDQERQEMLRKMWARLTGKQPLDMVA